jgi:hypothetical protein
VPVSTLTGSLILIGNNPYSTGTCSLKPGFEKWYREEFSKRGVGDPSSLSEVDRGKVEAAMGIQHIISRPLDVAALAVRKAHIFWVYPITNSDANAPLQFVAVLADLLLYLSAVLGMVRMTNSGGRLIPLFAAVFFFAALPVVMHAEARYRLPLVPIFCMFAAWSALPVAEHEWSALLKDGKRLRRIVVPAAGIILVYAVTALMVLTGSIAY